MRASTEGLKGRRKLWRLLDCLVGSASLLERRRTSSAGERRHETTSSVIASEAKQSILPRKARMDCFAALAKTTKRTFAASPRDAPDDRPREAIHRPGRLC